MEAAAAYQKRLAALTSAQARGRRRDRRLGGVKVLLALALVGLGIYALAAHVAWAAWVLIPLFAALLLFAARHERLLRQLAAQARGREHYQRGLRRLAGDWRGDGERGERFADRNHPYSRDLDLFGPASLYQLLCTARTAAGQATVAGWLLSPAPPAEIAARQAAVAELSPALELRERLAMLSEESVQAPPEQLIAWAEAPGPTPPAMAPMVLLAAAWIATVVLWAGWGWVLPIAVLTVCNLLLWRHHRDWAGNAAEAAEAATAGLGLLESVPPLLAPSAGAGGKLAALGAALPPARHPSPLCQLRRRLVWLEARHHMLVRLLDPVLLWSPITAAALERWRRRYGPRVREWLGAIGEFEALLSLASYAFEHPADVFPSVAPGEPVFAAEGLGHPLLPDRAVRNDFRLGRRPQLVVLSGPNMAGKSTWLRAVGLGAVLAQCGAPVRARRLSLAPLAVAACMTTQDSLSDGVSGFAAEVLRLKQLAEIAAQGPTLILVDELLRGTNPEDRRAGASAVYQAFLDRGAIGLVTTHDPALTALAAGLAPAVANVHLGGGQLETDEVLFDYRLYPGPATAGNALALLRNLGFPLKTAGGG